MHYLIRFLQQFCYQKHGKTWHFSFADEETDALEVKVTAQRDTAYLY